MQHMLRGNLAIVTTRVYNGEQFTSILASKYLVEMKTAESTRGTYCFPLYLYNEEKKEKPMRGGGIAIALTFLEPQSGYVARQPNLSPRFIAAVKEKLKLDFVQVGRGDWQRTFGPEDIFHYAYAIFHSPTYRQRYAEFLKIDFPRLPLTSDRELFKALAGEGEELVALHLMESPQLNQLITRFPVVGSNEVEKVRYAEPRQDEHGHEVRGRVYINKTQYFEGVPPEVWAFQIGGYRVLHNWLNARKDHKLSFDDLFHYQKIVVALKETIRLMEEIDSLIPAWPIE
jgi:predicted helicase